VIFPGPLADAGLAPELKKPPEFKAARDGHFQIGDVLTLKSSGLILNLPEPSPLSGSGPAGDSRSKS
jgi:hypothetical protein